MSDHDDDEVPRSRDAMTYREALASYQPLDGVTERTDPRPTRTRPRDFRTVLEPRASEEFGLPSWVQQRVTDLHASHAIEPYSPSDPRLLVIYLTEALGRLSQRFDTMIQERTAIMDAAGILYDPDDTTYAVLGKLAAVSCATLPEAVAEAVDCPAARWFQHVHAVEASPQSSSSSTRPTDAP